MLSTKANTLASLSPLLTRARINRLVSFTHEEWQLEPSRCIDLVQTMLGGPVAVRSSALNEDTLDGSNAGAFQSILGIACEDRIELGNAVQAVFDSYRRKGCEMPGNQVLVQEQATDIFASGVCTTRSLNGGPYYVITYAEGNDTSAVTSGSRSRVLKVLRGAIEVPGKFRKLLAAIYEIERLLPDIPLDIEFGLTHSGEVLIFQVRTLVLPMNVQSDSRLAVGDRVVQLQNIYLDLARPQAGLSGSTTFLADMTDWNPAEMIGDRASNLAFSLYDELITGAVWSEARASQGYDDLGPRRLVHLIGNKPYVDIRCCFNSFVPAGISGSLRHRLIEFYMSKLKHNPALQDKVEFDVLFTCYDASFSKRIGELLDAGFSDAEVSELSDSLLSLTNRLLDLNCVQKDLALTRCIDGFIESEGVPCTIQGKLEQAERYIEICKKFGTLPFARLARLAFVSSAILKGFVPEVLSPEDYDAFYLSVNTVAREFQLDSERLSNGTMPSSDFLKRYGHLRPGTYDITSLRYDERDLQPSAQAAPREVQSHLGPEVGHALWNALREHGLRGTVLELFSFARGAMEAREEAKFHFTKLLSEVLRLFTDVGSELGFTREELSMLALEDIKSGIGMGDEDFRSKLRVKIEENLRLQEIDRSVELPALIFSPDDFEIILPYQSRPTFVTQQSVTADIVVLSSGDEGSKTSVAGKIAVLERGDPGYDWIFSQQPAGLVTKYGGAGSHMAIRCNEFSLPAAIGCGEDLFQLALMGGPLTIDCGAKVLRSSGVLP